MTSKIYLDSKLMIISELKKFFIKKNPQFVEYRQFFPFISLFRAEKYDWMLFSPGGRCLQTVGVKFRYRPFSDAFV